MTPGGPRSAPYPVRSWPEDLRRRYRAEGHWTSETFADFVADRTERYADAEALVGRDARGAEVRWTYAELGRHSDLAARRFAAAGIAAGDRVVVTVPNLVEFVAVVLGLFRLGAWPVFALPTHREHELTAFCAVADAAALVACSEPGMDRVALHGPAAG